MTALQICQIAVAVFGGNVLTMSFLYGMQKLRSAYEWKEVSFKVIFAVLVPIAYATITLTAALPATP